MVGGADIHRRWRLDPAEPPDHLRATGVEHASLRPLERARDVAGNRREGLVEHVELRQRVQQPAGIGVSGRMQHLAHRARLDDPPQVHHRHPIRGLRDHPEVVSDEQDRHAELGHQLLHQIDDLRLDGHVQRGGRLVRDEELGMSGERHRDHRPLAHPTGELEGVLVEAPPRVGDPHPFEHLHRVVAGRTLRHVGVQLQLLHHLVADGQARSEARHRFLEDHRDGAAAHHHQVARPAQAQHVDAAGGEVEADPALRVVARVAGVELHQGLCGHRLARAGLADEAEHFPGRDPERSRIDRGDQPLVGAKAHREVLHLDERSAHRCRSE